jgi:hypothetical protein
LTRFTASWRRWRTCSLDLLGDDLRFDVLAQISHVRGHWARISNISRSMRSGVSLMA